MSAEAYGARLLAEVHEESLASLLSSIWAQNDPDPDPITITGLTRLDGLIDRLQPRAVRGALPDDFDIDIDDEEHDEVPPEAPVHYERRKPVMLHVSDYFNVHSLSATALLHELVASSVLPYEVGGKGGIAVYIDCTKSFEPELLSDLLIDHLDKLDRTNAEDRSEETGDVSSAVEVVGVTVGEEKTSKLHSDATPENSAKRDLNENPKDNQKANVPLQMDDGPKAAETDLRERMVESASQHVHILDCDSSTSLLGTLRKLPAYLLNIRLHQSGDRLLRLICISGIDNFYWMEREALETARLEGIRSVTNTIRSEPLSSQILRELKAVQARFDCPLAVYSTTQTPGPDDAPAEDIPRREQSDDTPLFNNYAHSALLTLQPSQRPRSSTLPRSFEGIGRWKDDQAGVPDIREVRLKPYVGGAAALVQRAGVNQEVLRQLDLRMTFDEDSHFVFDM